jgi:hypothetical protein
MTNEKTKAKTKPRTSPDYDLELATMANCKRLIRRLPTDEARWRVISYLQTAVMGAAVEPAAAPDVPANQTALFE